MEQVINTRSSVDQLAPAGACPQYALGAEQKAQLYRVLAQLFLYEIDGAMQEQLNDLGLAPLFEALAPGCSTWLATPVDHGEAERLACLYADLFLMGKGSVSLQAGSWLEGQPGLSLGIESLVRDAEPQGAAPLGNLPPDHLGVLLCYLAAAEVSAQAATRAKVPELTRQLLASWVPRFVQALRARTDEPVYVAAGAMLLELITEEI